MKHILIVYFGLALALSACTSSQEETDAGRQTTLHVSVAETELPLTGRSFYFGEDQGPQPIGNQAEIMRHVRDKLVEKLHLLGFEMAPSYRSAHLTADAAVLKMLPQEIATVERREQVPIAEGAEMYSVLFGISVRDYGLRPREILSVKIVGTLASLADVKAVKEEIDRIVGAVVLVPPAKNKKMKGEPSCMPSFGYAYSNAVPGKPGITVIAVTKKSPAAKAGLKIGDRLVSVNGQAFSQYLLNDHREEFNQYYESKMPVTFKIDRDGASLDLKMTSKISCGL